MRRNLSGAKWRLSMAVFLLTLLSPGPLRAGDLDVFKGLAGTLKISGGTAHIPVMKQAAKRIMRFNPKIRISIAGGGSGVGIKQVGEGLVDIGNSGRKPTPEEIGKYNLKLFKWAVDGVAVVVSPGNPVRSLTAKQLRKVFSGKTDNWKAVGGPERGIDLYTRDKASGTRAVFGAIGYVSVGFIDDSVAPVALDGVMPSLDTVKSGKYPVARGLYSNTRGEPKGLARAFIHYLFSPEGQKIAAAKGFIPVK